MMSLRCYILEMLYLRDGESLRCYSYAISTRCYFHKMLYQQDIWSLSSRNTQAEILNFRFMKSLKHQNSSLEILIFRFSNGFRISSDSYLASFSVPGHKGRVIYTYCRNYLIFCRNPSLKSLRVREKALCLEECERYKTRLG